MKKDEANALGFEVDKLTNSIENVITGDSFRTEISVLTSKEVKSISRKSGWLFNWNNEMKHPERDICKLTIAGNPKVIQGLISLEVKIDHVFIHLLESAGFNKGKSKMYSGVPGNLVAYACKVSFQRGHQGNIAFIAKTQLIEHYKVSLGALHFGGRLMIVETQAALKLIDRYF